MNIAYRNIQWVDTRAALDALEYLKRGGCIGAAWTFLGLGLKINPIITLRDGVVQPAARERSRVKAINCSFNFVMKFLHIEEVVIEDATSSNDAELLGQRFNARFPKERIDRSKTPPVIGTHTGPGLLLVVVLGDRA